MEMNWFQKGYHNSIAIPVNEFQIALIEEKENAPDVIRDCLDIDSCYENIEAAMNNIVNEGMTTRNIKNILDVLRDFIEAATGFQTYSATPEEMKYTARMNAKFARIYAQIQMALFRYYEREERKANR